VKEPEETSWRKGIELLPDDPHAHGQLDWPQRNNMGRWVRYWFSYSTA
jgi:hypothetical protein